MKKRKTLAQRIQKISHNVEDFYYFLLAKNYNGIDLTRDIARKLPHEKIETIFDVGANIGQTCRYVHRRYPKADIYSFEPNLEVFRRLQSNISSPRIKPFNFGFGSAKSKVRFEVDGHHTSRGHVSGDQSSETLPLVEITTIDCFCAENNIDHIDILKIDTEGYDLEVIRGAERMIASQKIGAVIAECSMNCDNRFHVSLFEINQFMESHGYRLFGLYEQVAEWVEAKPNLRRTNCAFISPAVILRNTAKKN